MAKVVWADGAIADIADIISWISDDNPRAALRIAERLMDTAGRLDLYPQRGRMIDAGRREIVVVTPYLIRYRIDGHQVTILEVRHAAREPD